MEFGLGKNRQIRDAHPTSALITLPSYEAKGNARAALNDAAFNILGLTSGDLNEIAFSTENNQVYLINANNFDSKANIRVMKNGSYSNKTNFVSLKGLFNTELEAELLLEIVATDREFDGQTVFELVKFTAANNTTAVEEITNDINEIEVHNKEVVTEAEDVLETVTDTSGQDDIDSLLGMDMDDTNTY